MQDTAKSIKNGYLKDRPFMIIKRIYKPASGQNTSRKDWGKEGKWEVYETASFNTKVSKRDMSESDFIIDLLAQSLVKNRSGQDSQEIIGHYASKYKNKISEAIGVWMGQRRAMINNFGPLNPNVGTQPTENIIAEESSTDTSSTDTASNNMEVDTSVSVDAILENKAE